MNTFEAYIFRRALFACIGSTVTVVALVWTTQAVSRIDFTSSTGGSVLAFLEFMIYLLPRFLSSVLPFGLVIGSVLVLNSMNSDSEMPVAASAGMSRLRIAKPFLLIGLLCSVFVFLSNHLIEPKSNAASRDLITQLRTDLLSTLIQEGRFTEADDDLIIYVDRKSGQGLEGIMIADTRNPELHFIYYAKQGVVGEVDGQSLLVLSEGEIHRKNPGEADITIISFQSYAISLSQFDSADGTTNYRMRERSTAYLLDPDPNDKMVKWSPGQVQAELHKRMTGWLYPIVMVLVALVLAGQPRSHRGPSFMSYVLGFGTALLYYGLSEAVYDLNKTAGDHLYLIYLVPIFGVCISAWMYLSGRTLAVPGAVLISFDHVADTIKKFRVRMARKALAS